MEGEVPPPLGVWQRDVGQWTRLRAPAHGESLEGPAVNSGCIVIRSRDERVFLPTVTVLPGKRISFRLHSQFRCMPSVGRQMITGRATGRSVLRWWEGLPNGAFINNFMPIPFGGFGGDQAPAAPKKRLVVDQTWLGDPPPPLVSYFGDAEELWLGEKNTGLDPLTEGVGKWGAHGHKASPAPKHDSNSNSHTSRENNFRV